MCNNYIYCVQDKLQLIEYYKFHTDDIKIEEDVTNRLEQMVNKEYRGVREKEAIAMAINLKDGHGKWIKGIAILNSWLNEYELP